jgi:hypothetical protein
MANPFAEAANRTAYKDVLNQVLQAKSMEVQQQDQVAALARQMAAQAFEQQMKSRGMAVDEQTARENAALAQAKIDQANTEQANVKSVQDMIAEMAAGKENTLQGQTTAFNEVMNPPKPALPAFPTSATPAGMPALPPAPVAPPEAQYQPITAGQLGLAPAPDRDLGTIAQNLRLMSKYMGTPAGKTATGQDLLAGLLDLKTRQERMQETAMNSPETQARIEMTQARAKLSAKQADLIDLKIQDWPAARKMAYDLAAQKMVAEKWAMQVGTPGTPAWARVQARLGQIQDSQTKLDAITAAREKAIDAHNKWVAELTTPKPGTAGAGAGKGGDPRDKAKAQLAAAEKRQMDWMKMDQWGLLKDDPKYQATGQLIENDIASAQEVLKELNAGPTASPAPAQGGGNHNLPQYPGQGTSGPPAPSGGAWDARLNPNPAGVQSIAAKYGVQPTATFDMTGHAQHSRHKIKGGNVLGGGAVDYPFGADEAQARQFAAEVGEGANVEAPHSAWAPKANGWVVHVNLATAGEGAPRRVQQKEKGPNLKGADLSTLGEPGSAYPVKTTAELPQVWALWIHQNGPSAFVKQARAGGLDDATIETTLKIAGVKNIAGFMGRKPKPKAVASSSSGAGGLIYPPVTPGRTP